jgi:hypothetical protein
VISLFAGVADGVDGEDGQGQPDEAEAEADPAAGWHFLSPPTVTPTRNINVGAMYRMGEPAAQPSPWRASWIGVAPPR